MTSRNPVYRVNTLRLVGALLGLSAVLGACNQTTEIVTASVPNDYRQRHPIAVTEANRSIVVFVGHARGGLSAPQRNDVMGLAQTWVREGTGAIVADVPIDTANARAAAASFREIQSVLMAGGVPSRAITLRPKYPVAFSNRAFSHYLKGEHDLAIADANRAIALEARLAMAHANLGHALAAKGDARMAARSYRRALELDPDPEVAEETLEALEKLGTRGEDEDDE